MAESAPLSDSRAYATRVEKTAAHKGATHVVRGVVARVVYPAGVHATSGFAIVELGTNEAGERVRLKTGDQKAQRPRLDCTHFYAFACTCERSPYGPTYIIAALLEETLLPFDRPLLAALLQRELALPRRTALNMARACASLDINALLACEEWFEELFERSDYFVETHLRRLERVWPRAALRAVPRRRLGELEHALQNEPLRLCFWWLSRFDRRLDELTEAQLVEAAPHRYSLHATARARLELECVRFYTFLRARCHAEGHMYASEWDPRHGATTRAFLESEACAFAEQSSMLRVVTHYGCRCVYALGDVRQLESLRANLLRIAHAPKLAAPRAPPTKKRRTALMRDDAIELVEEQRNAVTAAMQGSVFVLTAPPGSGKTSCARAIYRNYEEGEVLALSFMGLTSAMLKRRVGRAMTIDKLVQTIHAAAERAAHMAAAGVERDASEPLVKNLAPRVLAIDEFSTIDFDLLARLLEALRVNGGPPIESLLLFGDVNQNTSIGRGALMPTFMQLYGASPRMCARLLLNHRIGAESQLLLRNLRRVLEGNIAELEVSRDAASAHPFLLLERPATLRAAAELIAPFLKRAGGETAQLLVQRNREREAFNALFYERDAASRAAFGARAYAPHHFCVGQRIMFLENRGGSPKRGIAVEPLHMRSNGVKNGVIAYVRALADVFPDAAVAAAKVAHTAELNRPGARRMLYFEVEGDDKARRRQISLAHYPLEQITLVEATTIAKLQGGECDTIALFVHAGLTQTFTKNDLVVALSRAKRRIVVVCSEQPRAEWAGRNDLEQIVFQAAPQRYSALEHWLPTLEEMNFS
jgi:hypothetical protein